MIAISMRVDQIVTTGEKRVSLDLNWREVIPVPLLPISPLLSPNILVSELNLVSGVILSGGNDVYPKEQDMASKIRKTFEKKLLKVCLENKIPIFGVCYGLQLIASTFGAKIKKLDGHVACDHDVYRAKDCPIIFDHFPQRLTVNSFHNFGILDGDLLNSNLLAIYRDKASNIEAITSADGSVMGTMWHPERSFHTKCDVLQTWLAGCVK